MNDLISIIIPVYKVEKYLNKCVDSVLEQTYKNIEVILVDDGSPDECSEMCDRYKEKDRRVRVIHKENGGLSSARNAGIEIAKGSYIGFVDSDDYIDPEMYEELYKAIIKENAGMAICGIKPEYETKDDRVIDIVSFKYKVLDTDQMYSRLSSWKYVTAWNKLYRAEIWNTLRYPNGKIHEDEFVIHRIAEKCDRVVFITGIYYHYLQRGTGIMGTTVSEKHFNAVEAFIDRYNFFESKGLDKYAYEALRSAYGRSIEFMKKCTEIKDRKYVSYLIHYIGKTLIMRRDPRAIKLLMYRVKYHI